MNIRSIITTAIVSGVVLAGGVTSPASAHVTANLYGATATSGGYGVLFLRVPHGCDGDATNALTVTIPEGVSASGVKPQQKAGWTITRSGNTITWSGGHLADNEFDDFGLNLRYPTLNAGEDSRRIAFPAVQVCNPEVSVARKGANATVTASLPTLAGKSVGVFSGETRIGSTVVSSDGEVSFTTNSAKAPAGTPISLHRGGRAVANSNKGIAAWTQVAGDGSNMNMPAPTVTVVAAKSSGHGH